MDRKKLFAVFTVLSLCSSFELIGAAQGGWPQWDIYLRDGTKVEANPLSATGDGRISISLKSDASPGKGIELSRIDYIAARASSLPPAPTGSFKQDLIVLRDGRRVFGRITSFKADFSSGELIQNKKRISLEDIAYIKFTKPKVDPEDKAPTD